MIRHWPWALAAALYLVFLAWYVNWSGPVAPEEVEELVAAMRASAGSVHTDPQVVRTFLEEDDGGEFVMLNLVRLHEGNVEHPGTGQPVSPSALVAEYTGPFFIELLKRGGHPVQLAPRVGGYVDSWHHGPDPGWHAVSMVRYKSRRDLVELMIDPRFADVHAYKLAAIDRTVSFPTQRSITTFLAPSVFVPALLLLLASLAQNFRCWWSRAASRNRTGAAPSA
jgi:hypothetical protein